MTLPPVIRVFFAIEIPPTMKERLAELISALRKKNRSNAIRWVRPENLHITLQFMPDVRSQDLNTLVEHVRTHMALLPHLNLQLGKMILFPNPYRPRVIVLDTLPQESLEKLAQAVGQGVQETNYPLSSRPFRGHLTLGRIKYVRDVNLDFLADFAWTNQDPVPIHDIVLFRSEPQPEGSLYTPIARLPLHS